MVVKIKCQRKTYISEVYSIYTKETEQGLISTFLVYWDDHFQWVDSDQCVLSKGRGVGELSGELGSFETMKILDEQDKIDVKEQLRQK